jgi:integrase
MQSKHDKRPPQATGPRLVIPLPPREPNVSKDRMWRSFPGMPHLLQHVPTLRYYAKIKIGSLMIHHELYGWIPEMIQASLAAYLQRLFVQDPNPDPRAVELFRTLLHQNFPDFPVGPKGEIPVYIEPWLRPPEPDLCYVPTPENFERLLKALTAARKGADTAVLVRFMACSGCRVAEARQLNWADIDWEHGELVVNNGLPAVRRVPFNPSLRELLEEQKKRFPDDLPNESVFRVTACRAALKVACDLAGIPPVTPLDLRYLFIFRAKEAGADLVTIGRWLGHKSLFTLSRKVISYAPEVIAVTPEAPTA